MASISASSSRRSSNQVEELLTARAHASACCGYEWLRVKNSMKRRLPRSPWTRIIAGSASSRARAKPPRPDDLLFSDRSLCTARGQPTGWGTLPA